MQTMQMIRFKKSLPLIVCIVLIAAMALLTTGCNDNSRKSGSVTPEAMVSQSENGVLGEGTTQFTFTVTDAQGQETSFQINTDRETVGEALQELGLIEGEKDIYGLYVKTVNGITVDYNKDGKYWAFYVNGQYATKGIDATKIADGSTYSLKVE